jgi:broad specificity phosphatase PhoE
VQERVGELVGELAAKGEDWVVLVSHVGPIKGLLALALGLSLEQSRRFFLDPATVTVIDWRERPLLRLFNSHGHLGWTQALWMGEREQPPRFEQAPEV